MFRKIALIATLAACGPSPRASVELPAARATSDPQQLKGDHPEIARTRKALETLHAAVDTWRASQPGECPSVAQLKDDKALALSFEDRDAWGMPYEVRCDEDTSFVVSRGPDKRDGTTDDLSFP